MQRHKFWKAGILKLLAVHTFVSPPSCLQPLHNPSGYYVSLFLTTSYIGACRCSNAETQILTGLNSSDIGSADFNPVILAEYYLLGQGGSLNAIAKTATGVDFDAVNATVGDVVTTTITVSFILSA